MFLAKTIQAARIRRILIQAMSVIKSNTPVITGVTRASWFFEIDGKHYKELPIDNELLLKAKVISIRNSQGHILDLSRKRGIMILSSLQIQEFLRELK